MMSKKWLSLLLALVLVFSATACTKAEEPVSMEVETTAAATEATTAGEEVDPISALAIAYFDNMPEHRYMISAKDLIAKIDAGEAMTIVDIRSAEDYGKGHLKGAVNMPWGPAIAEGLATIPSDKPVFIYCYTGQTAGQAVMTMNMAGLDTRSISLGWNFGISKYEGIDAYSTTDVATLSEKVTEIPADVQAAITAYYEGLGKIEDARFKNYKVSEDDLKAMMESGDDSFVILSVRSAKDYAVGHIEGASNIPFAVGMAQKFEGLPTDKKIVVYCYTGQTAGQATATLRMMGYDAVSLNGGMGTAANVPQGWSNKGYPVVSDAGAKVAELYTNLPDHKFMIGEKAFIEKVVAGEDMTILDIRTAEDYAKGHVKGAVSVPWGTAIAENLVNIPSDKPLYIYCYTGQTASQAVTTLNVAGFDAKTVNLGWNFGISKVEGVDAVTTTDVATLPSNVTVIEPSIQFAITAYYEGLAPLAETKYKFYKVSEDALKEMVDAKDESIVIVSARKPEDYAAGHIEGAINVPFGADMIAGFESLPRNKTIVAYCYTGQTAGQMTAALRLMGYKAVSLNGGMGKETNAPQGWLNKGFPVVTN